jgi:UDP-galactopyranose mutase
LVDYLIVGAGLYGATFARTMTDHGKTCLVIDKRSHIAGNVFSKTVDGIEVHQYGPHIFHTNSEMIWDHVRQFATFNDYRHKVLSDVNGDKYSFPINLKTLESLWGEMSDAELLKKFESVKSAHTHNETLEDWAIAEVGEEIYRKFIYGYTKKQWGTEPANLPRSIITRIPVRNNRDDNYHAARFSGIPVDGYTSMVANMLDGIRVVLDADYLENRSFWDSWARTVVYTGPVDEFFDYEHGEMKWRSLNFQHGMLKTPQFQDVAQVNYPDEHVPYTRSIEHKHFVPSTMGDTQHTVVTLEYPQKYIRGLEKYYPVCDDEQRSIYEAYRKIIPSNFIFGGRLAMYRYYDMDQVIASALNDARNRLC